MNSKDIFKFITKIGIGEAITYYLSVAGIQALLLLIWRHLDHTSFIIVPITITSILAVAATEVIIVRSKVIRFGSSITMRSIGGIAFAFLIFSNSLLNIDREILSNVVFDRLGGLSFNTHSILKFPPDIDHLC